MIKPIVRLFFVICVLSLVSCGGGSGGCQGIGALFGAAATGACGVIQGQVAEKTLPGVVVDGLIEGALVCLDLNVNLVCDAGEPSAVSKSNGGFSLSLAGLTTAQIRGAHVIVSVSSDAKDSDDGGQTLAQVGKAPFNLMSPVQAFVSSEGAISPLVASPLTTLISHEMISGVGKASDAAEATVVLRLGMSEGTNLHGNFFEKTDNESIAIQKHARFISAALGEVKAAIGAGASNSSDRERQLAALNYVKTNLAGLVAVINRSTATTAQASFQAAKAALASPAIMPTPIASALVSEARSFALTSTSIDATTVDGATLFGSTYHLDCQSSSNDRCTHWELYASSAIGAGMTGQGFTLTDSSWVPDSSNSGLGSGLVLTENGWRTPIAEIPAVSDGAGGLFWGTRDALNDTLLKIRLNFTFKDIGGSKTSDFKSTDFMGSFGSDVPTYFGDTAFPTGSKVMSIKFTNERDIYASSDPAHLGGEGHPKSISELISTNQTTAGINRVRWRMPCIDYLYGKAFACTFDAGGSDTKGTMTRWTQADHLGAWTALEQKGAYEVRTVMGQSILFYVSPASKAANRAEPSIAYAVINGLLRQVVFVPKGITFGEGTNAKSWNDVAMRTILAGAGLPSLPQ